MKRSKKILSLFLAAVFVLSLCTLPALATANGTCTHPSFVKTDGTKVLLNESVTHTHHQTAVGYNLACQSCNYVTFIQESIIWQPHVFLKSPAGTTLGPDGSPLITYRYTCRLCEYEYLGS